VAVAVSGASGPNSCRFQVLLQLQTSGVSGPDLTASALEDIMFHPQFWNPSMYAADFRWDEMEWSQLSEVCWSCVHSFAADAQERRDGSVYIQHRGAVHAAGAAVDQSEPHTP
jgi:hypothetical protein